MTTYRNSLIPQSLRCYKTLNQAVPNAFFNLSTADSTARKLVAYFKSTLIAVVAFIIPILELMNNSNNP